MSGLPADLCQRQLLQLAVPGLLGPLAQAARAQRVPAGRLSAQQPTGLWAVAAGRSAVWAVSAVEQRYPGAEVPEEAVLRPALREVSERPAAA